MMRKYTLIIWIQDCVLRVKLNKCPQNVYDLYESHLTKNFYKCMTRDYKIPRF